MIVFDVETGPLPDEQLDLIYQPPPALPPWDEAMVRYGNTKDEGKRKEKRDKTFADYAAKLAQEADEAARHKADWKAKAALSALTGRVVAIGTLMDDREPVIWSADTPAEEADVLRRFWTLCERAIAKGHNLIGHNCHGFDLPFLAQRSFIAGTPWPTALLENGRYWHRQLGDTMRLWACGNGREYVGLGDLGLAMGCGQKADGCDGATFAQMWLSGDPLHRADAAAYLIRDLTLTRDVARRMGMA